MELSQIIIAVICAYIVGSIPSAVWVGKFFYGIDVREHGSGNAGTTNVFRVLGVRAGIPVLLMDVFKGFASAKLVFVFGALIPGTKDFINMQFILGAAAVIGHIFPVFAKFDGGKGVATLLGIVLAIVPVPAFISLGIFVVTLLLSRYVSLSSLMAGLSFPFLVIIVFQTTITSLMLFSVVVCILLLLTHQKNIERLIRKEESKANLFKKKKNQH